jgi:N6-L-threonylcarbamoyladenine synthase
LRGRELTDGMRADVARGFQEAVVDTLAEKARRALRATGHRRLVVAGGVGANRKLRERLAAIASENGAELYFPRTEFCTDNGAMIALAGCLQLAAAAPGFVGQGLGLGARARWPLPNNGSTGV